MNLWALEASPEVPISGHTYFRGNSRLDVNNMRREALTSTVLTVHSTYEFMVHMYTDWEGGCLLGYYSLQQKCPYLKGVLIYREH